MVIRLSKVRQKTNITNGNQTIGAGGKATTNSIDNTTGTHGYQAVSGTATDNTLKNADQIIEKPALPLKMLSIMPVLSTVSRLYAVKRKITP